MSDNSRELSREEFRSMLLEIPSPPKRLWLRGALPPNGNKCLAVVGSRAATSYGKEACAKLIEGLRGYPVSIISGLALGIDGEAHKAALRAGLHTLAVPGSGLGKDVLYPRAHLKLAEDILHSGGGLLSQHEDTYQPQAFDFPSRNRIMVGLAHAVLVIEAGVNSGTLITARLATEYNRDLLCVPHRMGDPHGFAAHLFIRLGAGLIAEPAHLLLALGFTPEMRTSDVLTSPLEGNEKSIYELLQEPLPRDELIRIADIPMHEALSALVTLELKGVLKEEFGMWRRV